MSGAAPRPLPALEVEVVATGLGSDAGIENFGQVLDFLAGPQPAVAGRIKEHMT